MSPSRRSRPSGKTGPARSGSSSGSDSLSVGPDLDILRELDDLADYVDGAFVVLTEHGGDRYRRRCFLTVKAAENAARKAVERGENVRVYLAELKPLWKIAGGDRG